MKNLNQYITEYIIKKKLDKPIDSEDNYDYYPESKEELVKNIKELIDKGIYNFNCINTIKITDMSKLFEDLIVEKNFDVSKWDVSNVTDMSYMFLNCKNFDCDLSKWDVSSVKDMSRMFIYCIKFTGQGLENWDVSNVTDMMSMFGACESFEGKGLENWNVHNVENMSHMFNSCERFKGKYIENWDVSNVTNMMSMFFQCINLDCDLSKWDVRNVEYMN